MDSIWDLNLREFRNRTASSEPTPGGGSVAAVAAAQGLALVLMALEISARRKDAFPETVDLLKRGKDLMEPLSKCADDDMEAFAKYMKVFRMPRRTPEEEEDRNEALDEARAHAMETPLRTAQRCLEGLTLAHQAVKVAYSGIVSDVGAGAALLHGALTATLYNVDINLKGIADPKEYREALAAREDLQRRGNEMAYVVHKETEAKIAG